MDKIHYFNQFLMSLSSSNDSLR